MSYNSKGLLIDRFTGFLARIKSHKCNTCKCWCNCSDYMGYRKVWICDSYIKRENN